MPTITYHELLEACHKPGCPVCRLIGKSVQRALDTLLYEYVNDGGIRNHLKSSRGFCHEHAWQAVELGRGHALGIAILHRAILEHVLAGWPDLSGEVSHRSRLTRILRKFPARFSDQFEKARQALTATKQCPVCEKRDNETRAVIFELVESLPVSEMREAFNASSGLCLPHLRIALKMSGNVEALKILIRMSGNKMRGLLEELSDFIRKSDYRYITEGFQAEGDSWLRSVGMISGENISGVFSGISSLDRSLRVFDQ